MTTPPEFHVRTLSRMIEEGYRRETWNTMSPEERDWVLLQLVHGSSRTVAHMEQLLRDHGILATRNLVPSSAQAMSDWAQRQIVRDTISEKMEKRTTNENECYGTRSIYVASKAKHGGMWRGYRGRGWPIISSWIDRDGVGEIKDWAQHWSMCITEAMSSDVVLWYHEDGETPKGSMVEVGAALAMGHPVILCCDEPVGTWYRHPNVTTIDKLDLASALHTAAFEPT